MLDKLITKIQDLEKQIQESAARHNGLIGALTEMKNLYQEAIVEAPKIEAVVEAVEQVV